MRTDSRLTTYNPNKDSTVQLAEAESNLNTKNQQAFMNNIIGSDPKRLTNIIDNFGNSQSDSFIGLGTNSQRLIIGSIPSVNLTPTRKRQKENGYDPFTLSDKPSPSTRDERAKRFFANGKYATGEYKKWIEDGGCHDKENLDQIPEDVEEVIHAKY